jgi:hypothetical protein
VDAGDRAGVAAVDVAKIIESFFAAQLGEDRVIKRVPSEPVFRRTARTVKCVAGAATIALACGAIDVEMSFGSPDAGLWLWPAKNKKVTPMNRSVRWLLLGAFLSWSHSAIAADKPAIDLPIAGIPDTPGQQLQNAVNNPANAGVRIQLARGHYLLDPLKPNGGRLYLQPGMDIVGENAYVDCDQDGVWDALITCLGSGFGPDQFTVGDSETLIDGTAITAAATGNPAVMRIGCDNVVSHVTVLAPRRAAVGGGIDINLPSASGGMNAVVSDSIVMGGQRGIRSNNGAPALSGIASSATIERNIIRDSQPVAGGIFSFGIQLQNNAATASSWTLNIRRNRVYRNRFGYFIVANSSQMATNNVLSMGNIIQNNELGMFLGAGFAPGGLPAGDSSNNGSFNFNSNGDRIEDNVTPAAHLGAYMNAGGGVVAFAAARDSAVAGGNSGNTARLQFLHATFRGNARVDSPRHMMLFGSFSSAIAGPVTGVNNVLTLLMRQTRMDADATSDSFLLDDSQPDDATATNRIRIIGSDRAFSQTNVDVPVPPEEMFIPWQD